LHHCTQTQVTHTHTHTHTMRIIISQFTFLPVLVLLQILLSSNLIHAQEDVVGIFGSVSRFLHEAWEENVEYFQTATTQFHHRRHDIRGLQQGFQIRRMMTAGGGGGGGMVGGGMGGGVAYGNVMKMMN
jgi:hypothetical protein